MMVRSAHLVRVLGRNSTHAHLPDGRLWLAVVCVAVLDIELGGLVADRAAAFISCSYFDDVCERAGLNSDYVRDQVRLVGTEIAA